MPNPEGAPARRRATGLDRPRSALDEALAGETQHMNRLLAMAGDTHPPEGLSAAESAAIRWAAETIVRQRAEMARLRIMATDSWWRGVETTRERAIKVGAVAYHRGESWDQIEAAILAFPLPKAALPKPDA